MTTANIIRITSQSFILFSALSLLAVSMMAFADPQAVMDLVQVKLTNTDAYSSIRGVYGGVGMTLFISLLYLMRKDVQIGLAFLSLFWACYALSRTITIYAEGVLGSFGTQWLLIELTLCIIASVLLLINRKLVFSKAGH